MNDVELNRKRIRPGTVDRVREWYGELQAREDEVVETMRHDGVLTETAFVAEDGGDHYLYVYMESPDVEAAQASGSEEPFEIHEEHHEVLRETLTGEWESLERIAHFTNPDRG